MELWDSAERAAKGSLGSKDGSTGMIDVLYRAAHLARIRSLDAAREYLTNVQLHKDPRFLATLKAVLEVLPVSKSITGFDLPKGLAAAGSDFEVLEKLRRLKPSSSAWPVHPLPPTRTRPTPWSFWRGWSRAGTWR